MGVFFALYNSQLPDGDIFCGRICFNANGGGKFFISAIWRVNALSAHALSASGKLILFCV